MAKRKYTYVDFSEDERKGALLKHFASFFYDVCPVCNYHFDFKGDSKELKICDIGCCKRIFMLMEL